MGPIRILKFSLLFPFVYAFIVYKAQNFEMLVAAWMIQNLCLGIENISILVFLAETAPIKSRDRWTVAGGICATCGRVVSTFLAYIFINEKETGTWKYTLYTQAVFYAILALPITFYFQESLRYLYANKKYDELVKAINRIIKINKKSNEQLLATDFATLKEIQSLAKVKLENTEEKRTTFQLIGKLFGKKYAFLPCV